MTRAPGKVASQMDGTIRDLYTKPVAPAQAHMAFEDEWEQLELLTEDEQLALEEKDNREIELLFNDEGLTDGQLYYRKRQLRERGLNPILRQGQPTGITPIEGESRQEFKERYHLETMRIYRTQKRIEQGLPPPKQYMSSPRSTTAKQVDRLCTQLYNRERQKIMRALTKPSQPNLYQTLWQAQRRAS